MDRISTKTWIREAVDWIFSLAKASLHLSSSSSYKNKINLSYRKKSIIITKVYETEKKSDTVNTDLFVLIFTFQHLKLLELNIK